MALSLKKSKILLKDFVWKEDEKIPPSTNEIFKFQYVSRIYVEKELKGLKRHKATGPDNLPPTLLKDSASQISKPLSHIINLSLKSSTVPYEWKKAKITPIFKSGSSTKVDNYRPISVLPVFAKILEKCVHSQVINYLEDNNLLCKEQFGYRRKRSTEMATTLFIDDARRNIDEGKLVGAVFIDISKAFDTIGHSKLLSKLSAYGIFGPELEWFTNYLFDRTQFVTIKNTDSYHDRVLCGVPQGSILGPLLFLIYYNDLQKVIKNSKIIKFADDTVVYYAHESSLEIEKVLNDELKQILKYFNDNDLVLNTNKGKTEVMLFGTQRRLSKHSDLDLYLGFSKINNTNTYKYLGTTLDKSLSLKNNFEKIYKKISSRLRLMSSFRANIDQKSAQLTYNVMISPLFTFNCIVHLNFTNTQIKKITSLDERAHRLIYGTENIPISSLRNSSLRHACGLVRKCLDKNICSNFHNYFHLNDHQLNTRNSRYMLKIPKIKLETARSSFYFMGAVIYNKLPLNIRKIEDYNEFQKNLKEFNFPF